MRYGVEGMLCWRLLSGSYQKQLKDCLGKNEMKTLMNNSKREYRQIIKRCPSIGGLKNEYQLVLVVSALAAAFYKNTREMMTLEQAGRVFTESIKGTKAFKIFCGFYRNTFFTDKYQTRVMKNAVKSREKKYDDDWVYEARLGKTVDEFYITYTQCGICRLLEREGIKEIGPCICEIDFIMAEYMNARLERTQTLNCGDGLCDFHYTKIN